MNMFQGRKVFQGREARLNQETINGPKCKFLVVVIFMYSVLYI